MAVWILIPDKLDDADAVLTKNSMGVFGTTVVTFFLAEMGDKTQIVTIALAARFHQVARDALAFRPVRERAPTLRPSTVHSYSVVLS
jgi:hypothetical protein